MATTYVLTKKSGTTVKFYIIKKNGKYYTLRRG